MYQTDSKSFVLQIALGQTRTDTPKALDPKSSASTNSATRACRICNVCNENITSYINK